MSEGIENLYQQDVLSVQGIKITKGDLRRPALRYPAGIVFQARLQPREAVASSGYLQRTLFPPGSLNMCYCVPHKGDAYEKNIGSDHDNGGGGRPVGE